MTVPFVLALAGQSLIARPLSLDAPGLGEVAALLGSADVAFTNLETAIAGAYGGTPQRATTMHVASPAVLDTLQQLGISLLALASNHAYDLGPNGIASSLEETARRGFVTAGAGPDAAAARRAGIWRSGGRQVALLAWNASPKPPGAAASPDKAGTNSLLVETDDASAWITEDALRQACADVAAVAEHFTVVYVHQHYWIPDVATTPEWLVAFAHAVVDAGADVVVCHGPPVLHGLELYRRRPVFYGLGSLVFHTSTPARYPGVDAWESVVATCRIGADGALGELALRPVVHGHHPGLCDGESLHGAPRLASGELAAAVLGRFAARSLERHGTRLAIHDGTAMLERG